MEEDIETCGWFVFYKDQLLIEKKNGMYTIPFGTEPPMPVPVGSIEGTNLYDAVVENINGGLEKVAELLGRNEAELATTVAPAGTGSTSKEYEAFDMNKFL